MPQVELLTTTEAEAVITNLRDHPYSYKTLETQLRNTLMGLLMLDAGLRVGEAIRLVPADVYWSHLPRSEVMIRAEISKTNDSRNIPTSERLQEALSLWHPYIYAPEIPRYAPFLFTAKDPTRHISRRSAERLIEQASLRALGKQTHCHVLRHTFADRLRRVTDLRTVQALLGHKCLTSTQVYTHPSPDDQSLAIKAMHERTSHANQSPQ